MVIKNARKPNRLKNYDYSSAGWYYVTICTYRKSCWFGDIRDRKMKLNRYGEIVEKQWLWLEKHFEYIELDEYIVMPNHFHGILMITKYVNSGRRDNPRIVPTNTKTYQRRFNTLSKTINAFKTTSSKLIHKSGLIKFKWQRSFYDHIIRNEKNMLKIRKYINLNPIKWGFDKLNSDN